MTNPYHEFTSRDFVLDDLFRRWVLQPNEQSMTFWHTFMLYHPAQQAAIDEAASLLLHLRASYDDLTEANQQRIGYVLEQAAAEKCTQTRVRPMSARTGVHVWRMAASLAGALLIAGGSVWYMLRSGQQRVHTAFGETRSVTLPDGSTVLLNGNSTLTFTSNWNDDDKAREVWLDGEGYFKVTRKRRANDPTTAPVKFVTHTPTLDITVLGTQFNVNTRRGSTAVMLVEGRVQLNKTGQARPGRIIEMKPGQLALTLPNIENVAVRTEKPQLHTSWTQHTFVFENATLSDIARQLGDTYGVELIVDDAELANRRFTGNLSNQDTETLLTTLAMTFDLGIRHDGDRVILQRNP